MNTCEHVMFITAIACSIFECFSKDEIEKLAAEFSQLGDTLNTMLVNYELCQKHKVEKESEQN